MSNKTEDQDWIEISEDGSNIPLGYAEIYHVKNIKNGYNFKLRTLVNGNFIWKMFKAGEASHFKLSSEI